MDNVLLIVLLVLASLILVAIVSLFICLLKRPSKGKDEQKNADSIARIEASLQSNNSSLQSLKDNIPVTMKAEINSQMVSMQKTLNEQNELNNKKLNDFQTSINDSMRNSLKSMNDSLNIKVDHMNESLNKSVSALNEKVTDNLVDLNKKVGDTLVTGFKGNSDTMGELKEKLGKIDEAQKHLEGLQNQVITLNNVLANNQARGQYGELQLEMLLEATFPNGKGKYYNIQDDLGMVKDGEKVRPDADVVFTVGDSTTKLCIDSKFPFADYSKLFSGEAISETDRQALKISFKGAVKNKIQEVSSKYLIPGITMKYAIMFVPNDGVFAYIENEYSDLVSNARASGVIIAAPSTLQAIIVIFHGAAVDAERNKNLEIIDKALKSLGDEFARFSKRWDELEGSINAVSKKTKDFTITVDKIGNKFTKINQNQLTNDEKEETPAIRDVTPKEEE